MTGFVLLVAAAAVALVRRSDRIAFVLVGFTAIVLLFVLTLLGLTPEPLGGPAAPARSARAATLPL